MVFICLQLWWRWEVQQGLGSPAMLVEPLLEQEQDAAKAAAVIAKIMTTIITSFSELQVRGGQRPDVTGLFASTLM